MLIETKQLNGDVWYMFEKGNFSYECAKQAIHDGAWTILTTDKRLKRNNWTTKVKYPNEMKANIWQNFFALVEE